MLRLTDRKMEMERLFDKIVENLRLSKYEDNEKPTIFGEDMEFSEIVNLNLLSEAVFKAGFTNDEFEIRTGASKAVVVFKNYDYVLKIPFCCNCFGEEVDYFECAEVDYDAAEPWDYCAAEEEVYNLAYDYHVEEFFAETSFFNNTKGDYPVYIQKKVAPFYDSPKCSELSKDISCYWDTSDYFENLPRGWKECLIDKYGINKTFEFLYFINEIYPHVTSDLHRGNVGFDSCGNPVILDYSSYDE
jgi:hypothetical protein